MAPNVVGCCRELPTSISVTVRHMLTGATEYTYSVFTEEGANA